MPMYIRFHKGRYVDAVIPSTVGIQPTATPGDVIWEIPTDINPSKTVLEEEPIQTVDPNTGQSTYAVESVLDENGNPTVVGQDDNGNPIYAQRVVTQTVSKTYKLMERPDIFTMDDIAAVVISYGVVSNGV